MIAFCAAPVQSYALPPCHYEHNTYCGEDIYEPGSLEASYVDYVQGVWKCDTRLAKKGALCGRWSNLVRKTFSSSMKSTRALAAQVPCLPASTTTSFPIFSASAKP